MKLRSLLTMFILAMILALPVATALAAGAVDETVVIYAKALTSHECNSSEWHFVITDVDSEAQAPASILVYWANGASETVALSKYVGKVAHYTTYSNLNSTVTNAATTIYSSWGGQFNL